MLLAEGVADVVPEVESPEVRAAPPLACVGPGELVAAQPVVGLLQPHPTSEAVEALAVRAPFALVTPGEAVLAPFAPLM